MSNRLDQEREANLGPHRRAYAKKEIVARGYEITFENELELHFIFKGSTIKHFFYSGWHTGKTIKDGRGLENLLKQITHEKNS